MGVFEGVFPQWAYLVGYNAVSALLWLAILARAVLTCLLAADGPGAVYPAVRTMVLFTQTLAALEILHAAIGMCMYIYINCTVCLLLPTYSLLTRDPKGLVRAPVLTTFVQIAGRSTVLWAVIEAYPVSAAAPNETTPNELLLQQVPFYAAMVLAWSAADAVRYCYFAARLLFGAGHRHPRLTWLRYSAFYALYPVGIAGEVGVVARAVAAAWAMGNSGHAFAYLAAATLYIPGESVLFCLSLFDVPWSLYSLSLSSWQTISGRG